MKLSFEKNLLTVASASQELGEGTETLDVEFDGEPLSIGLNAQYLLDFLEEAETENVRLELKDENTQCLCSPEGGIEGASRYLVRRHADAALTSKGRACSSSEITHPQLP